MIRPLLFKLLTAFAKPSFKEEEVNAFIQFAQKDSIRLRGSKAERLAKTKEWSKRENIERRVKELEAMASEALERGKELSKLIREEQGLPEEDPPLPDPLPDRFKGQPESTIRAMLRQEKEQIPCLLYGGKY